MEQNKILVLAHLTGKASTDDIYEKVVLTAGEFMNILDCSWRIKGRRPPGSPPPKRLGNIYFPKQSEYPFYCYELVL